MKILIAPDKFKGSLSGNQICTIISEELSGHENLHIECLPLADGGDGTISAIQATRKLIPKEESVHDPLFRPIQSNYYLDGTVAWIELAEASGYVRLQKEERNPMYTSSFGTGELIRKSIENGAKKVMLLLGGSSTNDAGIGILSALGVQFFDINGNKIKPVGEKLINVHSADTSELMALDHVQIEILTDVRNPLFGPQGAAYTYGSQKGASLKEIELLDSGLKHFAELILDKYKVDVSKIEGGGAAGGIAAGLSGFLNVDVKNGFETLSTLLNVESRIAESDIIISGEGSFDSQSASGKVVSGVAAYAKKYKKHMIVVAGRCTLNNNETQQMGIQSVYTLTEIANSQNDAIQQADKYLKIIAKKLGRELVSINNC